MDLETKVALVKPGLLTNVLRARITLLRRGVQLIAFVLLLYGAFIWPRPVETFFPPIPSQEPRTTLYDRNRILWVSGKESVVELYMPFLACRFIARGGLFKSCTVHFLSENITWRTSLTILLPHLLLFVAMCVLAGRFWCGWICPLGAMMDAMTGMRKALHLPRALVPPSWKCFLAKLRHFLLFLTLGVAVLITFPIFGRSGVNDSLFLIYCQFCPARLVYPPFGGVNPCWYDTTNSVTIFLTLVGWLCLGVFFLSFAIPRFWCRICAIGALVSYFNRGALLTLEKNHQRCTSCGACRRCCPMDIERVYREQEKRVVTDTQCLLCLTCVEECPEEGCLQVKLLREKVVQS
ncbi:MAG TPA: 4Fe-4S binding protein [Armatimonadetes bacterium]|nr:4Fe-4S binding protein [Armatimonadota bacterium]